MKEDIPLVNSDFTLEKFPEKSGWTYVEIPQIVQNKKAPFGWVKVKGWIDDYEIKGFKLMPMGNGKLLLPVKAEIRKKIGKKEGDVIKIILFADEAPTEIPQELLECFENEPPEILQTFLSFSESEQKAYLDWIYGAKKEETKAQRIVNMMDRLSRKEKFFDKINGK